jgi:hypothetical protein
MPVSGGYETEGTGIKASAEKRKAQAHFTIALLSEDQPARGGQLDRCLSCLDASLRLYRSAYRSNMRESREWVPRRSVHWVLCQYLSLRAVLGEPFELGHWSAAMLSANIDLQETTGEAVVWPHGTLAELHFLLLAYPENDVPLPHAEATARVLEQIRLLLDRVSPDAFAVQSTRRQFLRYASWWGHPELEAALERQGYSRPRDWWEPGGVIDVANQVIDMFARPAR